jgi:hypothetical protein
VLACAVAGSTDSLARTISDADENNWQWPQHFAHVIKTRTHIFEQRFKRTHGELLPDKDFGVFANSVFVSLPPPLAAAMVSVASSFFFRFFEVVEVRKAKQVPEIP